MLQALNYGVSYFMLKPFDFEHLMTKIREIMNRENIYATQSLVSNEKTKNVSKENIETTITNIMHEIGVPRSEEHTSELQSRFDLVCRLLLAKKNTKPTW